MPLRCSATQLKSSSLTTDVRTQPIGQVFARDGEHDATSGCTGDAHTTSACTGDASPAYATIKPNRIESCFRLRSILFIAGPPDRHAKGTGASDPGGFNRRTRNRGSRGAIAGAACAGHKPQGKRQIG